MADPMLVKKHFELSVLKGLQDRFATSVSVLAVAFAAATPAFAVDYSWTGTVSGDFGNGANWSGAVVPVAPENIIVDVAPADPSPIISGGASYAVGTVTIGNSTTGAIDITANSAISSDRVVLGYNAGAAATATINGPGASWMSSSFLVVGQFGTGILTVSNGGNLDVSTNIGIGLAGAQAKGIVTVDGSGSNLHAGGSITLGADLDTNGTLTAAHNSLVTAQDVTIGSGPGGTGKVTVSSNANMWADSIVVGHFGTGTLTLGTGGTAGLYNGGTMYVAFAAQSSGTVNIGAAAGDPAAAAGSLLADKLQFGLGTGQLVFNHTNTNYAFDPNIAGNGQIAHLAGVTRLTTDSSAFTGSTSVDGGTLAVDGKLGGVLFVNTAGRLQGTGTVGETIVDGTIAPGNSIGTLNVAGNITYNAGSTYVVEVDAAGQSDKIAATGAATINGGSVKVLAGMGNYAPATIYTILTANGGRSGTFTDGVSSNLAFLDPSLTYDANSVYLTMSRNDIGFQNVGVTTNQIAIGSGVESLGLGNKIYDAVLNLSAPQAQAAFDALSGEIHASVRGVMLDDSRFPREAALTRLRSSMGGVAASSAPVAALDAYGAYASVDPTTDRVAVWGHGFGSWGHWNSDGNAARLDRSTGGFIAGADSNFDAWRLGAFTGYSTSRFSIDARNSSGSSDNYHAGLYGGSTYGGLAFRSGLAYTWHDVTTSRNVAFPGFSDRLKADYNAGTAQVFGEFAYDYRVGTGGVEPFANLAYVNVRTDGFTESGGVAALTSASAVVDATFTTLGLRTSTDFMVGTVNTTVRGSLGWRHAFGDTTPLAGLSFSSGGSPFTIAGVPIAENAAVLDLSLDMKLAPNAMLGISYGGRFGSAAIDQTVRANISAKF